LSRKKCTDRGGRGKKGSRNYTCLVRSFGTTALLGSRRAKKRSAEERILNPEKKIEKLGAAGQGRKKANNQIEVVQPGKKWGNKISPAVERRKEGDLTKED